MIEPTKFDSLIHHMALMVRGQYETNDEPIGRTKINIATIVREPLTKEPVSTQSSARPQNVVDLITPTSSPVRPIIVKTEPVDESTQSPEQLSVSITDPTSSTNHSVAPVMVQALATTVSKIQHRLKTAERQSQSALFRVQHQPEPLNGATLAKQFVDSLRGMGLIQQDIGFQTPSSIASPDSFHPAPFISQQSSVRDMWKWCRHFDAISRPSYSIRRV